MYDFILFPAFLILGLINAITDFREFKTSDLISALLWIIVLLLSLDNGSMLSFSFSALVVFNTLRQFIGWGDILFLPAHISFAWYLGGGFAVLAWLFCLALFSLVFTRASKTPNIPIAVPSFIVSVIFVVVYGYVV